MSDAEPEYRPVTVAVVRQGGEMTVEEVMIHPLDWCKGEWCPFDSPSFHHMVRWQKVIRMDKGDIVERTCPHGIGHPDPDSAHWALSGGHSVTADTDAYQYLLHGCDGCCRPPDERPVPESEV